MAAAVRAVWVFLAAGGVFVADRLTKLAVRRALAVGESRPVIPGVLHLTHVQNPGAAFGLLPGQTTVLLLVAALTVAALALALRAWREPLARAGSALVLGGAAGNLADRLRTGTVTDFIDLRVWPVFNLADVAIVAGTGLLALHLLRSGERPAAREGRR